MRIYRFFTDDPSSGSGDPAPAADPAGDDPAPGGGGADPSTADPARSTPAAQGQPASQAAPPAPRGLDYGAIAPAIDAWAGKLEEPQLPAEYKDYAAYQQSKQAYDRQTAFRQGVHKVFQGPVQVAPDVTLSFQTREEGQAFINHLQEFRTGQRSLTAQDLLVLHQLPRIIQIAMDAGARRSEKSRAGTNPATQPQRGQPQNGPQNRVVVPPTVPNKDKDVGPRGKTVEQLFKDRDPAGHQNFMEGKVTLT